MKKNETDLHYHYTKLFDAMIDKTKLSFETVGRDAHGNLILHISRTYNMSSAYSSDDEYFILTAEEYREYVEKARKNKFISLFKYRRFLREAEPPKPDGKVITSFEIITLHTSGMRFTSEDEIVMKDGAAEVSSYSIRYSDSEDRRVLEKRALCSVEEVLKLLNDCKLLSWDGFHGAHPRGVLDGIMFSFEATVNDGRKIKADGSENFPKHYRDFTDGIYNLLNKE